MMLDEKNTISTIAIPVIISNLIPPILIPVTCFLV
jgi:hypothetical protein